MTISRRLPSRVYRFADQKEWLGRVTGRMLDDALRALKQVSQGIPAGFLGSTPLTILVGGTPDPGTEAAGWLPADAQLVVAADPPAAILLGVATSSGSASSGLHSDMQQDTIALLAQVRNHIMLKD